MLLPKAWIYLQNACCIQLNLVLRERINHNCTWRYPVSSGFFLAWLLEFTKLFASLVISIINKPTTQLTSNANDFMNAESHACKRESSVRLDNSVDFFGINRMPARSCWIANFRSQWACMSQ